MKKSQAQILDETADMGISLRIRLLREMVWQRTHESFTFPKASGKFSDGSLVGNARSFAAWLGGMPSQIQGGEPLLRRLRRALPRAAEPRATANRTHHDV